MVATLAHSKWLQEFKRQYILRLFQEFRKRDRGRHSRELSIRALLVLTTKRASRDNWHRLRDIQEESDYGIEYEGGFAFTPGSDAGFKEGLDAWLDAGIVLREKRGREYWYQVSEPFLEAVSEAMSQLTKITITTP